MSCEPLKFQKKYRIASTRLRYHDYSHTGAYFVTICTKHKEPWFGDIKNGFMCLSDIGQIVWDEWLKTSVIRPEISLGEFIVMPDHVHGIMEIHITKTVQCEDIIDHHDLNNGRVETHGHASLRITGSYKNQFGPQFQNLSSFVRGFKSAVTIRARTINPDFTWQPRFYDRIIRNQYEYNAITDYIRLNPKNWKG